MDRRVIGAMIGHGVKPEEVEDKLFLDTAEKDLARETSCSTPSRSVTGEAVRLDRADRALPGVPGRAKGLSSKDLIWINARHARQQKVDFATMTRRFGCARRLPSGGVAA